MKTVNEVAKLTGISVRTLHYYDEIKLLSPTKVSGAGYRFYDNAALARLQQILFFRELDFPLKEIRMILNDASFDEKQALQAQKKLLMLKKKRLDRLIRILNNRLKGEKNMSFKEFSEMDLERTRQAYAQEVRTRWGTTSVYAQYQKKNSSRDGMEWENIDRKTQDFYKQLADAMQQHRPGDTPVQELVTKWQSHISKYYYDCTDEILAGLGEMYSADERFRTYIDQFAAGLAVFFSEAIRIYCKK
ncbi:MAG: MerR family transcriptional regulator [Christensenella sp.]|nr:MerR family transcriptional regulator [Christensenella sp.]